MFSIKSREKAIDKVKRMGLLVVLLVPMTALIVGITSSVSWGWGFTAADVFEEAEIFFELNNTDEDLGIHGKIDGGPWRDIWIIDPSNIVIMNIETEGRLLRQAVTELFFESAEPEFDELEPEEFFDRFPEGTYVIQGWSEAGEFLRSLTDLTHVMPAPAGGIEISGTEIDLDVVDCEDEATIPTIEVEDDDPVTISWDPVTMSHPDPDGGGAGVQPPVEVTITNYEVVVEVEFEVDGEEFTSEFSVILPPNQTSMSIPAEFIALGDEFKYEILAREESGNQTAVESCFMIESDD